MTCRSLTDMAMEDVLADPHLIESCLHIGSGAMEELPEQDGVAEDVDCPVVLLGHAQEV